MRSAKGRLACWMALAIGIFVLGSSHKASAIGVFELYAQEDLGPVNLVASVPAGGPPFNSVTGSGATPDYAFIFFGATATNGAGGSNLLSSTTAILSTSPAPHTLNLFVSNQDYTLPVGPTLSVESGMGGTIGTEPGFSATATFRMWADDANGLLTIPGTFSNGLQPAILLGTTFDTGTVTGQFTRGAGPFSLTDRVTFMTNGIGDFNFSTHIRLAAVSTPEPNATLIMSVIGVLGLFLGVRRRKSS
jgi:hypothetical protein